MNAIEKLRWAHVAAAAKRRARADKGIVKVVSALEKKFGPDVLTRFAEADHSTPCLSTGFQHLDDLLTGDTDHLGATVEGTGRGLPRGRIVEIAGRFGSGKTTISLHLIAIFQRMGLRCAFVDAEHAVDVDYARKIGVDMEAVLFSQPDSAEQGLDVMNFLISCGEIDLVVEDSVAALVPQAELDGDMGDAQVGLQARLMGKALRKMKAAAAVNEVCVIFVNQLREKIGGFSRFGPQEQTTGGNALRFFADIRLDMRVVRQVRVGPRVLGLRSRLKCVKNKLASPFREVYVDVKFGKGVEAVYPSDPAEKEKKGKKKEDEEEEA